MLPRFWFRVSTSIALISLAISAFPPVASGQSFARSRRLNNKNFFATSVKYKRKVVWCRVDKRGRYSVGFTYREARKRYWAPFPNKKAKRALKRRGFPAACETHRPPPPRSCAPQDIGVAVAENSSVTISAAMLHLEGCPVESMTITALPQSGSAIISGSDVVYTPQPHFLGEDSLSISVQGSTARATLSVVPARGEFAGNPSLLAPYRPALTAGEIDHLLRKVGAPGDQDLRAIGLTQGREALVEAIINYSAPHLGTVQTLAANAAEEAAYFDPFVYHRNYWHSESLRHFYFTHLLKGHPLREKMVLFWHHHFSINLDSVKHVLGAASNWFPRDHFEAIRSHALGSFDDLLRAVRDDPAMGIWLNNGQNHYRHDVYLQSPDATTNDNFGRELMELFTLGRHDRYDSNALYFSEMDVKASALAMTGQLVWHHSQDYWPGFGGWYNGPGAGSLWFPSMSFRGPQSVFGIFPAATAINRVFDKETFIDYLLYSHPGTARNIGYKLFGYFAFPHPPASVADDIGSVLASNRYQVLPALRVILNSSAMFSPDAAGTCIESPLQVLSRALRQTRLPVDSSAARRTVSHALIDAGHPLFDLPSVFFGMRQCGASMDRERLHGESWLEDQLIFNRLRGMAIIIDNQTRAPSPSWPDSYLNGQNVRVSPLILDGLTRPTAEQVLTRLEERFEVRFNQAQRLRMLRFLNPVSLPWNPDDMPLVERRLAGAILAITSILPQYVMN